VAVGGFFPLGAEVPVIGDVVTIVVQCQRGEDNDSGSVKPRLFKKSASVRMDINCVWTFTTAFVHIKHSPVPSFRPLKPLGFQRLQRKSIYAGNVTFAFANLNRHERLHWVGRLNVNFR
jgi:hypothetical protein